MSKTPKTPYQLGRDEKRTGERCDTGLTAKQQADYDRGRRDAQRAGVKSLASGLLGGRKG